MKLIKVLALFSFIAAPLFANKIEVKQLQTACLKGKESFIIQVEITTENENEVLEQLNISLNGCDDIKDIDKIRVVYSSDVYSDYPMVITEKGKFSFEADKKKFTGINFGEYTSVKNNLKRYSFNGKQPLKLGKNYFWVFYTLNNNASLLNKVDAHCTSATISGKKIAPKITSPEIRQRIGVAVRDINQDGSKFFRIPGIVTTNKGTLIAIYDVRYKHSGDLSAKIDIGMSRSTDNGNTWEPMQIIMTMRDYANVPDTKNGVGDPCIVVDRKTGDIIVTALWCHNFAGRAWSASKEGMKPEDGTGQVLLSRSSDDGKTWSKPLNITEQVKDPSWTLILQGPGSGICLKDGTLVIPMQFQDGALNREPFATIMTSKDQGKSWKMGKRLPISTTEAQVVELNDGSVMINSRKKSGNLRVVATTTDLGETWKLHPTTEKKEIFPITGCMSSIIRVKKAKNGKGGILAFCAPHDIGKMRRSFISLKLSFDEGNTWTKPLVLDQVSGAYSSISMVGKNKIAVIYECGRHTQLAFELVPISELMQANK